MKVLDKLHRMLNRWRIDRHLRWQRRNRIMFPPDPKCQRRGPECAGKV